MFHCLYQSDNQFYHRTVLFKYTDGSECLYGADKQQKQSQPQRKNKEDTGDVELREKKQKFVTLKLFLNCYEALDFELLDFDIISQNTYAVSTASFLLLLYTCTRLYQNVVTLDLF